MDYVEFFYTRMCLSEDVIEDNIAFTKKTLKRYYYFYAENVKRNVEKSIFSSIGEFVGFSGSRQKEA